MTDTATSLELLAREAAAQAGAHPHGDEGERYTAVNSEKNRPLYESRVKVYPKLVHGTFRKLKWLVMALTLTIYYVTPWLRWERGPGLPDQAVLLDFPARRFYFFFLEIWPQEFYYVTGLLILAALGLFLVTSVAGRVWCGYTCPQTVWTDLFIYVERFFEGERAARIRLDKSSWSLAKVARKTGKHLTWIVIALATGGAWVFYFADAPTLATDLATLEAPAIAYLFIGLFALTTYTLGGIAREQVCIYMCPWPRIQGAMFDEESLLVSYKDDRGEKRGPHKKGTSWEGRGDCIDCGQCVAACPMGIDIRDGMQLECIQCALCIDACDEIMGKIGRPKGLIAYETVAKQEAKAKGQHEMHRFVRSRTLLYAGVLGLVGLIMLGVWLNRTTLEVNVLRDRNPPFVTLSSGGVRNGFAVKILNKLHEPRTFSLAARGLAGATLRIVGLEDQAAPRVEVATDALRELRVLVTVPASDLAKLKGGAVDFDIVVRDTATGAEKRRGTSFHVPTTGDAR